ncbi:MAG: UDP-N-acetylglucosamine 2-epimerase (non-hydrolyzing) [Thermodesulfobacteriota bacterium]|nr:UDP-N-acetylglucosamine 2-epimerase (non-hydrolyzing) [Thermodesulfobacteriota bacterium]
MNNKKIMIVFGTRPEAIKIAPIIKEIEKTPELTTIECITGQHRDMLDQVLKVFDITPQYNLNIMTTKQDLFDITTKSLAGLKSILKQEKPDLVLVQGDTTTSFIAGLAAFYLKIPIAHIEAGLRTYDKYSPFPEEKNRHLLSGLSDFHFAPTEWAKSNLLREGIAKENIWVTGNTVIDALQYIINKQKEPGTEEYWNGYFRERWNFSIPSTPHNTKLILVTGHRRENFGDGFKNICLALKEIGKKRKDAIIVYPVHLNPNVQYPVKTFINGLSNIHLIEPLEYEPFVFLMNRSYFILTDSGGIQEEAPSLGKPVLVMRNITERPEGIKTGSVKLVGTNKDRIEEEVHHLLDNKDTYAKMAKATNSYGDGKAAKKIVKILSKKI